MDSEEGTMADGGSGKRVGGLLLVVFGALLLLGGLAGIAVTFNGAVMSLAAAPLVVTLVGGALLLLGGKALKSGEKQFRRSADVPKTPAASVRNANPVGAVLGLLVLGGLIWFYFGGGIENQANLKMQEIENKVAQDAVTQYGIAKRNGSNIDVCVQAGMVTAAYLQAKDEAHYQQWKQTEKSDCAKAGIQK
jgi:hypothetical protein